MGLHGAFVPYDIDNENRTYLRVMMLSNTSLQLRMERVRVFQETSISADELWRAWELHRPDGIPDSAWHDICVFRTKLLELIACTTAEISARYQDGNPHITKVTLQNGRGQVSFHTFDREA